jgi:hypothetical protein
MRRFGRKPSRLTTVTDGEEISDGLRVIDIQGAARGEIAPHFAGNGGTLIIGGSLLNLNHLGSRFCPRSIARIKINVPLAEKTLGLQSRASCFCAWHANSLKCKGVV